MVSDPLHNIIVKDSIKISNHLSLWTRRLHGLMAALPPAHPWQTRLKACAVPDAKSEDS